MTNPFATAADALYTRREEIVTAARSAMTDAGLSPATLPHIAASIHEALTADPAADVAQVAQARAADLRGAMDRCRAAARR